MQRFDNIEQLIERSVDKLELPSRVGPGPEYDPKHRGARGNRGGRENRGGRGHSGGFKSKSYKSNSEGGKRRMGGSGGRKTDR